MSPAPATAGAPPPPPPPPPRVLPLPPFKPTIILAPGAPWFISRAQSSPPCAPGSSSKIQDLDPVSSAASSSSPRSSSPSSSALDGSRGARPHGVRSPPMLAGAQPPRSRSATAPRPQAVRRLQSVVVGSLLLATPSLGLGASARAPALQLTPPPSPASTHRRPSSTCSAEVRRARSLCGRAPTPRASCSKSTSSPPRSASGTAAASCPWRRVGCPLTLTPARPSTARTLVSILRVPSASNATTPKRPTRTVRFCIPAPRIHEASLSSPRLHVASHPSPLRQPEPRGSRSFSSDGAWCTVLSRHARREERRMASGVTRPISRRFQQDAAALRFRRRTEGKCGRCLAPLKHHCSTACRDPVRCLTCNLSGHKERECPLRLAAKQVKPTLAHPLPCRPSSSPLAKGALSWSKVAVASLQAPSATRAPPDQAGHSCIMPTSSTSTRLSPATTATRTPPTQDRHSQSAPTSSTPSDLALGNQMDVCFSTLASLVLASERCYKTSVDDVLSAENERTDLGLLQMQGKEGDCKTAELDTVLLSSDDAPCEGGHPSVDDLTMVLISSGDALCDGGFSSDDDEDEEMEELLPGLADQDQQELLLDGEEVGVWARREFRPVADVLDADAEAATIGNLLEIDAEDDNDDDEVVDAAGTTPSSGIVIRSVADLFCLPVVPLLPTPIPPRPRVDAALPDPNRRSSRLATKPQLSAVGKAQRVLHKKMGFDFEDMPLVEATKEFMNTCKKAPLSDLAICGVRTLLRLNLPSMTAADEALIGLAGPGGSDFPPPSALDVSA